MNGYMLHLDRYVYRFKYDKRNNVLYINITDTVENVDVIEWSDVSDVTKKQLKTQIPSQIRKIIIYYMEEVSPLADQDLAMRTLYIDTLFVGFDILAVMFMLLCGKTIYGASVDAALKLLIFALLLLFGGFTSNDFNKRVSDIAHSVAKKPDVKAYKIAMFKFHKMIEEVNFGKYDPEKK